MADIVFTPAFDARYSEPKDRLNQAENSPYSYKVITADRQISAAETTLLYTVPKGYFVELISGRLNACPNADGGVVSAIHIFLSKSAFGTFSDILSVNPQLARIFYSDNLNSNQKIILPEGTEIYLYVSGLTLQTIYTTYSLFLKEIQKI